ncbi:hypothetical protein CKN82_13000 [Carnobacterium divergens]|uniref:hypothetical protein n=1 Tax=Carnobacterium divergens TaxID=2748 RepID=UPI001071ABB9|nr:hypothetical protein [Carnobacterium divergens]MDT1997680.1 peptide-binding protein [Carnobacterium divergens]TFI65693.1 hypothetical protein CKN70_13130 [Carnobacterium divergens]TFI77252.1 hypothetical protein CKN68_12880 [Carnobacterium divergens]TFI85551.1 hypothetical protein CKN72_12715 [Carnobacterium divergens]TFI94612.1 hypothetical protein CKN67_13145 [Carnobacterium divergens]
MSNLDNFIGAQGKKDTPFDNHKSKNNSLRKDVAKPVKVREDLHSLLKIYVAKNGGSIRNITDKALEEYIEKHNIK